MTRRALHQQRLKAATEAVDTFIAKRGSGSTRDPGCIFEYGDGAFVFQVYLENMPVFDGTFEFEGKPFAERDNYEESIRAFKKDMAFTGRALFHNKENDLVTMLEDKPLYIVAFKFNSSVIDEQGYYYDTGAGDMVYDMQW